MSILLQIPTTSKRGDAVKLTDGSTGAKSDTLNLKREAVGVMLRTAGSLSLVTPEGDTQSWASGELLVGQIYPMRIKRVRSTGTGLTNAQFDLFFSRY